MILEKIKKPNDIHKIPLEDFEPLAAEIRDFLIRSVSQTGGHLASNLGVVELTLALHNVLDFPEDKLIWDVGHQAYTHKILTGRKDEFKNLRQEGGLSGFPKRSESPCDAYDAGHSSNSISAGLGYVHARDILGQKHHVVSVIGDGALTGGMAYEALNNAAELKTNFIIIINDNNMSISRNVGGMSTYLSALRTAEAYTGMKMGVTKALKKVPKVGTALVDTMRKTKSSVKQLFIPGMLFENMGLTYLGPVDGHNIEKLENILKIAKNIDGPKLIHVITKKGKGYEPAEKNPDKFHSTGPFEIETGKSKKAKSKDYSKVFGDKLVSLAEKNKKIVAITASMKDGTGLKDFAEKFKDRFFDVGIAEGHAIGMAAGMATNGIIPVVPIYASFYQRGYDQVIHDVCMQNLHVVLCSDRAGIVGADGETHQGILDLSFFNIVPNLVIMAPKNFKELEDMLEFAIDYNGPIYIRYPRGGEESTKIDKEEKIELGKAEKLSEGNDYTIVAIGKMVQRAYEISSILKKEGIGVGVINARFLKPFDEENIISWIGNSKVITIEDNIIKGGLGSTVLEALKKYHKTNELKMLGYPDEFIKQGTVDEIEKDYKLDVESILDMIRKWSNYE